MPPESGSTHIAVVGMAGRFPGAPGVEAFWHNLRNGVEGVRTLDPRELADAGVPAELAASPRYVARKGTLEGIELFDAGFFGLTPREAAGIDPQQRIFLECAHEALEDAGHAGDGRLRTGVFGGTGYNAYSARLVARGALEPGRPEMVPALLGNAPDFLATRVAYKLDLTGPAVTVQTACSTSLVAVHLAVQSLLAGECDLALAGGATVRVPQTAGHLHQEGGILSADGHCRAFDADADGTVNGCGAGIVVLRRLDDALADGDRVRAVILGSAINNDGAAKVAFTAPSPDAQADVIAEAQAVAGVAPDEIGYVEAHGTGTRLGDAIELEALARVFGGGGARVLLGSVKTMIGHLDSAAGVASLIKTVLALEHGEVPPSLHFRAPGPAVLAQSGRFTVASRLLPWPRRGEAPRRAGVSSFGFGGTNAHVVVQEAPAPAPTDPPRPWSVLCLSARTPAALEEMTRRLRERLRGAPAEELADAAFTLQTGRRALLLRRAWVCPAHEGARRVLEEPGMDGTAGGSAPAVVFRLAGVDAPAAAELRAHEPAFRAAYDAAAQALLPHLGADVRTGEAPAEAVRFAAWYAAGRTWRAWGVQRWRSAARSRWRTRRGWPRRSSSRRTGSRRRRPGPRRGWTRGRLPPPRSSRGRRGVPCPPRTRRTRRSGAHWRWRTATRRSPSTPIA
jgi:phthiocerol/phenolphthiocerol synthesis type-I polyketide synthase E